MLANLLFILMGVVIGAVAVPLYPPLFKMAEKIRAYLNFTPKA